MLSLLVVLLVFLLFSVVGTSVVSIKTKIDHFQIVLCDWLSDMQIFFNFTSLIEAHLLETM